MRKNKEDNSYHEGVDYEKDYIVLYHITKTSNLISIFSKGLIPQIGDRRKRCTHRYERESKEMWISFCKKSEIESWRKALYGKYELVSVLEVKVPRPVRRRSWAEGWEYGYFEGKIGKENIKLYKL